MAWRQVTIQMATVLAHQVPEIKDADASRRALHFAGFDDFEIEECDLREVQRMARILRGQIADQLWATQCRIADQRWDKQCRK